MAGVIFSILTIVLAAASCLQTGALSTLASPEFLRQIGSRAFWADLSNWQGPVFLVLGLCGLICGVLASKRRTGQAAPAHRPAAEPGPASAPELAAARRAAAEAQDKVRSLQVALSEAEQRLEAVEGKALAQPREAMIDAELINLLATFQAKGRLIDFLMGDITPYDDAQIGAAARIVHQGCGAALREYFGVTPIQGGKEGERLTLDDNYDADRHRLVGKVVGQPPFKGVLLHHGWQAGKVGLPRVVRDPAKHPGWNVIAPAEIEVG